MTFVIACAEIDLSVGSVAGLSSVGDGHGAGQLRAARRRRRRSRRRARRRHDQRRAGQPPGHPVVPGHARHAGHRRRRRPAHHRLRAAADPERHVQPHLRRRQLRPDPRPARLDGPGRDARRRRAGQDTLRTAGPRHRRQPHRRRVHRREHRADQVPGAAHLGDRRRVAGMLYAGRLQSGRFQWGAGDELSAIAAVDPRRHQPVRRRRHRGRHA